MASIIKKPLKDGSVSWQVFVAVKGFPRLVKTFGAREQAEKFGREAEAELNRQKLVAPPPVAKPAHTLADLRREKIGDLLARYFLAKDSKPRHSRNVRPLIKLVADARVADVSEYWLEDFIETTRATKNTHGRPYAYATVHQYITFIGMAIRKRAKEWRVDRPRFPFYKGMFPAGWRVKRHRRLMPIEERALFRQLRAIKGPRNRHWRLMVRFALSTGARLQELVLAEWKHIDEENLSWTIPAEHCKTKQERVVPLGARSLRILKLLRRLADPNSDVLFHTMGTPGSCSQQFRKIAARAGLVNFRFHDLRHEAISRLFIHNLFLTERQISCIVGHESTRQTRDYVKLRSGELGRKMR